VALAYLLVWTWQEHVRACQILGTQPAREDIPADKFPAYWTRALEDLLESYHRIWD